MVFKIKNINLLEETKPKTKQKQTPPNVIWIKALKFIIFSFKWWNPTHLVLFIIILLYDQVCLPLLNRYKNKYPFWYSQVSFKLVNKKDMIDRIRTATLTLSAMILSTPDENWRIWYFNGKQPTELKYQTQFIWHHHLQKWEQLLQFYLLLN